MKKTIKQKLRSLINSILNRECSHVYRFNTTIHIRATSYATYFLKSMICERCGEEEKIFEINKNKDNIC